jgi:hypothetical protein
MNERERESLKQAIRELQLENSYLRRKHGVSVDWNLIRERKELKKKCTKIR